jgi:hypothetical protein
MNVAFVLLRGQKVTTKNTKGREGRASLNAGPRAQKTGQYPPPLPARLLLKIDVAEELISRCLAGCAGRRRAPDSTFF